MPTITETRSSLSSTFATRRQSGPVNLSSADLGSREHPLVRKPRATPLLNAADQDANTIYWPTLCDFSHAGGSGYGLLYSTDHEATHADSGVFLSTFTDLLTGDATNVGRIYRDDTGGSQTETPSLIWDEDADLWRLYYQQAGVGGNQATVMATSPDFGVSSTPGTWTRVGQALGKVSGDPGDGHTGYATFFRAAGQKRAFSLYGGTSDSYQAQWVSSDWVTWTRERLMGRGTVAIDHLADYDDGWTTTWFEATLIYWRGRPWAIAPAKPATSGVGVAEIRVVAFPMRDDLSGAAGRAVDITPAQDGWESYDPDRLGRGITVNGRTLIPYRTGGAATGSFGLLEVY